MAKIAGFGGGFMIFEAGLHEDEGSRPVAPNRGTLWSLHYLRAAAALGVVVFHSLDDTAWQFELGAAGIHLFFTISGFVIWVSTDNKAVTPREFALARLRRIVPLYWLATSMAVLSTVLMPGYFWQATTRPINVLTSLLFIPHQGVSGGVFPILYQGWTLQYEMYFYALFCISLLLPRKARTPMLGAWLVVAVSIGVIFHPAGAALQTYTNPICLEFLAGLLAAQLVSRIGTRVNAAGWLAVAVLGTLCFVFAASYESIIGGASNLLIPLGTSAMIGGLVSLERAGKMAHSTWLRAAGEASYSTYLFQTLGFALVTTALPHVTSTVRVCLFVISAQVCGIMIHHYLELPLLRLVKTRPWPRGLARENSRKCRKVAA